MTNPSTLIFLGLAVVWAIVLLPEGIKRFSRMRRADSIRSFNHQLLALDRNGQNPRGTRTGRANAVVDSNVIDLRARQRLSGGRPTGVAGRSIQGARATRSGEVPAAVRRRRQEVTATLAAAVVLTLLCLLAFGRVFLVPQLLADVLLGGYLYLVAQANRTSVAPGLLGVSNSVRSQFGSGADVDDVPFGSAGVRIRQVPAAGSGPVAASR